ncbi:hypothetical protein [Flavobacterium sp.]|uniref:hypothetical protein n=1 Tax=Flavobacterium sp. TaxID=239 RepID=UPI0039E4C4B4
MKKIILFALALNFVSCSNDDDAATEPFQLNNNPVFDYYTIESTNTDETTGTTSGSFTTANLLDQKFFSETVENFVDGVSQGQVLQQRYFYENGHLAKRSYENDVRDFFYDGQNRLTGVNWAFNGNHLYYRFTYASDDQVYFERADRPYGEFGVVLSHRIILDFDAQGNVVRAGVDLDTDGAADDPHTFEYDTANNLTAIHKNDGTTIPVAYSDIRDNFFKLNVNTMGSKKNLMVYQAECYANLIEGFRLSPNLRQTDTQEAVYEFTLSEAPYYFKRTQTMATGENTENTTVTTFYFE